MTFYDEKKNHFQSIIHILDKTKNPVLGVNNNLLRLIVDIERSISNY